MRIHLLVMLAVILAASFGGAVGAEPPQGACRASIADVDLDGERRYNPFDSADTVFRLRVGINASGDCALAFTFASTGSGELTGERPLSYRLQDRSSRIINLDGVTEQRARSLAGGGSGSTRRFEAFVVVPAGQPAPPGLYRDQLLIELLDDNELLDRSETGIGVTVVGYASIRAARAPRANFEGAGGARLDFGLLETGEMDSVYLLIRSNSRYALDLSSDNAMRLARMGGDGGPASMIDYAAWLDGRRLELSSPERLGALDSSPPFRVDPMELRVRIGDTDGKIAGPYRDVITVQITPLQ